MAARFQCKGRLGPRSLVRLALLHCFKAPEPVPHWTQLHSKGRGPWAGNVHEKGRCHMLNGTPITKNLWYSNRSALDSKVI
jgi:hypothetical protein